MKKILFFIWLLLSVSCYSQFSKTHYIPPLSNSDTQEPQGQYMYISCPSLTPITFKIVKIGGQTISGIVSRDNPYVLDIGSGINTQLLIRKSNVGTVMKNKGYIVEAEDLVYVTVRLTATPYNWQAGGLVSKGLAALGTQFRIGAFTNTSVEQVTSSHYTFATILATENNTTISFGDIKMGVSLINNPNVGNKPGKVILNRGESYAIAVGGPENDYDNTNNADRDGLIGASITSDKPVAVNCGSFAGSNGTQNLDLGFDQIVSAERTGTEYIFIKGNGIDMIEKPLIVANEDQTEIYLDGSTTSFKTLKAGEYLALDGTNYSSNGNLYVKASKKVFAYQAIGGTEDMANQNMHFVPPLRCETPKIINSIPYINSVGNDIEYKGTVCIVTEKGADLNFIINKIPYDLSALNGSYQVNGPLEVTGNSGYVTYSIKGLAGNVSVFSTRQVYVSYFGSSGFATYGGFYSGFTFNPEISFGKVDAKTANCLPNVKLSVNSLSTFDSFKWYENGNLIGATTNSYVPTTPGFYHVVGKMTACNIEMTSDKIPVSDCPSDNDQDEINDNVDIDNENDAIANCTESLGDKTIDFSNPNGGTISQGIYSNNFNVTTSGKGTQSAVSFVGKNDGTFVSEVLAGKGNSITGKLTFAKPLSLTLEYPSIAKSSDLLSANGDFILEVPVDKTITVLNPDDQLLIDTNYDGVYESGITQYSSFQLRFRLNNGGKALASGTGTFRFLTHLVDSLSYTHLNLSDTENNKASFMLSASCLSKDTDLDGASDEIDLDDENDGIPDIVENLGKNYSTGSFVDANANGMNDAYEPGLGILDSDSDNVVDYLDLDSDNDGIFDLVEAGHNATDGNKDGIIDGNSVVFGTNGLFNYLETIADSGIINFSVASTDADGLPNYIDSDSDADDCYDAIEAGFSDSDGDGYLGANPINVNDSGKVTSNAIGYTPLLNDNYIIAAPITIIVQPIDQTICETQNTTFTLTSSPVDKYQWQVSSDGINFENIDDNALYSGSNSAILKLTSVNASLNNIKFRVILYKNGNSCNLISSEAAMQILHRPNIASNVALVQCDDNMDGITLFNLNQIESQLSADYMNQKITYYTSYSGAQNSILSGKISDPLSYSNFNRNNVWVRVENTNGCYNVSEIKLVVSVTQIPAGTEFKYYQCDDYIDAYHDDKDGIATFDFHEADKEIAALLPNNATYKISYFKTQEEALKQTDQQGNSLAIQDTSNYKNSGYPNSQMLWVRIDSSNDGSCVGLGPYVLLTVNALPDIELSHTDFICLDDINSFAQINAGLISGSQSQYSYQWYRNASVLSGEQGYYFSTALDGVFTCTVKEQATGCERTRTVNVEYSNKAKIENVAIADLSDNNKVTISYTGLGDYEFSIDNPNGPFQDSNVLENVEMGFHTVYVNDKRGCGIAEQSVAVLGAPKFFTPNGDSYNDVWKLKGVDWAFNATTKVEIFDRFGKLIKVLSNGDTEGWDGTFNGNPLPSDDYWFVIKMEDGRVAKGHFTLKR